MALILVMESNASNASTEMLVFARQGQPLAIAALVQQQLTEQLGDRDIEVTGWKRHGLLHLELLTIERPAKVKTLPWVRQALLELAPEHIRAIQISAYIYGHEDPCWMERMALASAWQEQEQTHQPRFNQPRWTWAMGAAAAFSLVALPWLGELGVGRTAPELVQEQQPVGARAIRTRSMGRD